MSQKKVHRFGWVQGREDTVNQWLMSKYSKIAILNMDTSLVDFGAVKAEIIIVIVQICFQISGLLALAIS